MKKRFNKLTKIAFTALFASAIIFAPAKNVKADAVTDALVAQQNLLYQQQLAQIQAYQAALQAQYQQAMADQYAKALLVFQEAQANQLRALQQSYMLNAVQAQQKAQIQHMIESNGYEYQQRLLNQYTICQQQALDTFKGYEGLK